jgi:hypothetical protein
MRNRGLRRRCLSGIRAEVAAKTTANGRPLSYVDATRP